MTHILEDVFEDRLGDEFDIFDAKNPLFYHRKESWEYVIDVFKKDGTPVGGAWTDSNGQPGEPKVQFVVDALATGAIATLTQTKVVDQFWTENIIEFDPKKHEICAGLLICMRSRVGAKITGIEHMPVQYRKQARDNAAMDEIHIIAPGYSQRGQGHGLDRAKTYNKCLAGGHSLFLALHAVSITGSDIVIPGLVKPYEIPDMSHDLPFKRFTVALPPRPLMIKVGDKIVEVSKKNREDHGGRKMAPNTIMVSKARGDGTHVRRGRGGGGVDYLTYQRVQLCHSPGRRDTHPCAAADHHHV